MDTLDDIQVPPRPNYRWVSLEDPRLLLDFDVVQLKRDGWYGTLVVSGNHYRLTGRTGRLLAAGECNYPWDDPVVLVGEYMMGTNYVSRNPSESGMFWVFDIHQPDQPLYVRLRNVECWCHRLQEHCFPIALAPAQTWHIRHASALWQEQVMGGDMEGLVFKANQDQWGSQTWGRVKRMFTVDYIVVEAMEGEGKHAGRMGSLTLAYWDPDYNTPVAVLNVGGGFSDQEREDWWARRDELDECRFSGDWAALPIVEIEGYDLFGSGAVRHPQFVRVRPDKTYTECIQATR